MAYGLIEFFKVTNQRFLLLRSGTIVLPFFVFSFTLFCNAYAVFLHHFWENFYLLMDKEKEVKDVPLQEPAVPAAPDKDAEVRAMLMEIAPTDMDDADIVDIVQAVVEKAKKDEEMNDRLVAAFQKEPRLAQVFIDLVEGKRSAANSFARYFGKDFAGYEEGTPEYDDFMAGEEERLAEMAKADEAKALLDKNLDESDAVIEKYCEEHKINSDEFRQKIDELLMPIMDGIMTPETCAMLDRAVNYDKDTKDAYDAGVVEGRNTNINAMRDDRGDGLPKGLGSQKIAEPKKKPRNSLIAAALEA